MVYSGQDTLECFKTGKRGGKMGLKNRLRVLECYTKQCVKQRVLQQKLQDMLLCHYFFNAQYTKLWIDRSGFVHLTPVAFLMCLIFTEFKRIQVNVCVQSITDKAVISISILYKKSSKTASCLQKMELSADALGIKLTLLIPNMFYETQKSKVRLVWSYQFQETFKRVPLPQSPGGLNTVCVQGFLPL